MKVNAFQQMKLQYRKLLEIGMAIALLFCVILFQGSKQFVRSENKEKPKPEPPILVQTEAIATKHLSKKPKVEQPRIPAKEAKEYIFDDEPIPDPISTPKYSDIPNPPDYNEGDPWGFQAVEKFPEPVGGFQAIEQNLKYPEIARRIGHEGQSVIRTKIDKKGNVVQMLIQKSAGFETCDENAMKAIQSVKWEPALQRDQPVSVWVSITVDFILR